MTRFQRAMLKVREDLGSYEAVGKLLGISGQAVRKWVAAGYMPATEYSGQTNYADRIAKHCPGVVTAEDLLPRRPRKTRIPQTKAA